MSVNDAHTTTARCWLRSLYDKSVIISLCNDKEPAILGRIKEQRIADLECSRNQLEVTPDFEAQKLLVKKVGHGRSAVNGKVMKKGQPVEAYHDDKLEVVTGKYIFQVSFTPANVTQNNHITEDRHPVQVPVSQTVTGVASIFLKSPPKLGIWEDVDNGKLLIFTPYNVESRSKIAGYDLDGTLITTVSGGVYPKDKNDWKLSYDSVLPKLKQFYNDGYKIVIFTNQGGIAKGKCKPSDFKEKIENIVRRLSVPIEVFIATSDSIYRKPVPGMWNYLEQKKNDGITIDCANSFYCGDAAGRPANLDFKRKKKDFACSDRLFAMNANITFYTPEEHFLNQKLCPYQLPKFSPASLPADVPLLDPPGTVLSQQCTEVIVMVGPPGSGKSHFAKTYLLPEGYVYANRDTLGTWQKCAQVLEQALCGNKSVVVDNTNPDCDSRGRYIAIAKKHNVPVRAFVMNLQTEHVKHNIKFRELTDTTHVPISPAVVNSYFSKYEEPSLDEGFISITRVNFLPKFSNPDHEKLYTLFLLEQ